MNFTRPYVILSEAKNLVYADATAPRSAQGDKWMKTFVPLCLCESHLERKELL